MAFTQKTETPDIVDSWVYEFQEIHDGDPLWQFLAAIAGEFRHLDIFIDELYEQRLLESATGRELEKLAAPAGVTRRAGEDDDALRFRARLRHITAASNGTARDIEAVLTTAFEDKDLSNINVTNVSGSPVTRFEVPSPWLDNIPLSREGFEDKLRRASPAGYDVEVVTGDTFILGESGSQGLGEGGLS